MTRRAGARGGRLVVRGLSQALEMHLEGFARQWASRRALADLDALRAGTLVVEGTVLWHALAGAGFAPGEWDRLAHDATLYAVTGPDMLEHVDDI